MYGVEDLYRIKDLSHALDENHWNGKKWLAEKLYELYDHDAGKILVVGGWYGNQLIPMLDAAIRYKQIHFIEQDEEALYIAKEILFKNHKKIKKDGEQFNKDTNDTK